MLERYAFGPEIDQMAYYEAPALMTPLDFGTHWNVVWPSD